MGSLIAAAAAVAAVQRGGPHLAGYLSKGTRTAENLKMNERHSAGRTDCKPFFGMDKLRGAAKIVKQNAEKNKASEDKSGFLLKGYVYDTIPHLHCTCTEPH